jgi:hypothetical protein
VQRLGSVTRIVHGRGDQGERRIAVPLKRIEELIDEGVLEPDALLIHGDYEHYRYDGGDD